MRKRVIVIVVLLLLLAINVTYSFSFFNSLAAKIEIEVDIFKDYGIINVNVFEEENKHRNITIAKNELFIYNSVMYIAKENYNPAWHGVPDQNPLYWAVFATDINWMPNVNYRRNSIVIYDDKYYITNNNYSIGNDWFINQPGTSNDWIRIEPIETKHFGRTNGRVDYTKADPQYVIYIAK